MQGADHAAAGANGVHGLVLGARPAVEGTLDCQMNEQPPLRMS